MNDVPDPATLDRYVAGELDAATAVSVELAMQRSPEVRMQVNARTDGPRLDQNLVAVFAELDAPKRTVTERALIGVSVREHVARILVATPALRRGWFIAIALALLFGLSIASPAERASTPEDLLTLLVLAPILPVIGVALAYGPGVDPAYEVTLSTPMNGFRLVLLRAVAVLSVTIVATFLTTSLADQYHWASAAWLVPSLALSCACLAAMTWLSPRVAGTAVSGVWLVGVLLASRATDDVLLPFQAGGQVALAVAGVVAFGLAWQRRDRFEVAFA